MQQRQEPSGFEYVVVSFVGSRTRPSFRRSDWPVHLTVLNSFLTELPPERLTDKLLIVSFRHQPFSLRAESKAMYGRRGDVSATVLGVTDELKRLHMDLLNTFKNDVEFKAAHFNGESYSPHISDQRSGALTLGESVPIKTISLVQLSGKGGQVISNTPLS